MLRDSQHWDGPRHQLHTWPFPTRCTASPLPHVQHSAPGSDPHPVLCVRANLEKLNEPRRAQKPHRAEFATRFPTSARIQAAFPELRGSIWTKVVYFAWGQAAPGEHHQDSITRRASPGEHHQDSSISVPSDPKFRAGSWPRPPGKGPEGLQREGKRRLGGTLARNRGLKINEGSVLSSELTETERTHADLC